MKRHDKSSRFLRSLFPPLPVKSVLVHPDDVLEQPGMTLAEKRALLASWASDANCVSDDPSSRQLENGAVVQLVAILNALRKLDEESEEKITSENNSTFQRTEPSEPPKRAWYSGLGIRVKPKGRRDDGGDDPPPSAPAALLPTTRPLPLGPSNGTEVLPDPMSLHLEEAA